jgi:hypothetical protein
MSKNLIIFYQKKSYEIVKKLIKLKKKQQIKDEVARRK